MSKRRMAIVVGEAENVAAYLPDNYQVVAAPTDEAVMPYTFIAGEDAAGWTLDDYVLPRLASGLYWGHEIESRFF